MKALKPSSPNGRETSALTIDAQNNGGNDQNIDALGSPMTKILPSRSD